MTSDMDSLNRLKWWQKAVFYQIYPRSFADANGDGIGDFKGIIDRLDYLQKLGIDAIWLSPHYPSPGYDCGYDISDYMGVAPEYGLLDDFQSFLEGAHQRGLRVILDLVLNHTSDQHAWFKASRSSRDNSKRDWYVWRDGRDGGPPNNWVSPFGGSAWEYDQNTDQYYYHYFFKSQPDLNWENPELKQEMFDMVRFWLDMGVDGFRLDAIGTIFENQNYPDHSVEMSHEYLRHAIETAENEAEKIYLRKLWKEMFQYQVEQPGMHELMQELRKVIDEYQDCVLVAENDDISYHGTGDNELHLVFNFPLMRTSHLTPRWVRLNQDKRLKALAEISPNAWPCNTLGNHDSPRVYNRYGDGNHDHALSRISLALMLTLRGTPFLYNGEEIGMVDLYLEDISQFRDMMGVWRYQAELEMLETSPAEALKCAAYFTRDKNRTPMQWSAEANAGFSSASALPWLPIHPNYKVSVNVAAQEEDPDSLLNFYRYMLTFRKNTPALIAGTYKSLHTESDDYLSFLRVVQNQTCLVILNMSTNEHEISFDLKYEKLNLLYSNKDRSKELDSLSNLLIFPFEIFIGELS